MAEHLTRNTCPDSMATDHAESAGGVIGAYVRGLEFPSDRIKAIASSLGRLAAELDPDDLPILDITMRMNSLKLPEHGSAEGLALLAQVSAAASGIDAAEVQARLSAWELVPEQ